jgi:hypothetical protein
MIKVIRDEIEALRSFHRFRNAKKKSREFIFFCDSPGMAPHITPIMNELVEKYGYHLSYIATNSEDPYLESSSGKIDSYFLGRGLTLPWFLKTLDSLLLVSTTPGFGTGALPRSVHPVHYAYVHHAMVSTHMVYLSNAFDAFDSIFCTGYYHEAEIRAREKLAGLPKKKLVRHGNAKLDDLLSQPRISLDPSAPILIAPSWGENGLLETCGEETIKYVLDSGYEVLLRPHPETIKNSPSTIESICRKFERRSGFHFLPDVSTIDALYQSSLMISDWSGAALEFALGLERPVIFIDVPRKVKNPEYNSLNLQPIEVDLRNRIGRIVSTNSLSILGDTIEDMLKNGTQAECRSAREQLIFNPGQSASAAAEALDIIWNEVISKT